MRAVGWIVLAKEQGDKALKQVSPRYDTRAGAEAFAVLWRKAHPTHEVAVTQRVTGAK